MKKVFRKMKKRLSGDGADKKKVERGESKDSQSSQQDGSTSSENRIKEVAPKAPSSAVARKPTITEETSTDDTTAGKGKSRSASPKRSKSPKRSFSPLRSSSPKRKDKDKKKEKDAAKAEPKKDSVKDSKKESVKKSTTTNNKEVKEPSKKKEEPKKQKPEEKNETKNNTNSGDADGAVVDKSEKKDGDKEGASEVIKTYSDVPTLETTKLPRGGISVDTKAVGRVQFGIPPETIKDSMRLGLPVPQVYIVPVERFCREMGPALGVNLAEFEFPAYFNFFVYKKRCTLVVDSADAEQNIRRVFSETLLGPAQFRREENPIAHEQEDFSPDFDRDARPNFQKELKHFRIMPDGKELVLETLLDFRHFHMPVENVGHENLGVLRRSKDGEDGVDEDSDTDENEATEEVPRDAKEVEKREKTPWNYNQARWQGDVATVWPPTAAPEQIAARNVPRVEIFKMPGGTEYIVHDIDKNNYIIGKARFSGHVKVSEQMSVEGFGGHSILDNVTDPDNGADCDDYSTDSEGGTKKQELPRTFHPPSFGVTVLGNSHGFDKSGSVSGYVLWINGRGVMIDPPPYSSATLEREGIRPRMIVGIIITHCHADHDAGAFQKVLTGSPVVVITTPTIYKSFIRKYAALSALSPALLRHSHRYKPAIIGQPLRFQGATFHFTYTLHTIPCVGFRVEWRGRSMVFTGDHFNSPPAIDKLEETGVLSHARAEDLRQLPLQETDLLLHEAGAPPIHTPLEVLMKLPSRVKRRLYVVHTSALPEDCELRVAPTGTAGTIRLDQLQKSRNRLADRGMSHRNWGNAAETSSLEAEQDMPSAWNGANSEYDSSSVQSFDDEHALTRAAAAQDFSTSFANLSTATSTGKKSRANSMFASDSMAHIPLVSLRPASSTDAWFILNLLSAVPFLSSLSYASTMEVLETCRVDAYCANDVVVPTSRRSQLLCVVWEGTCAERRKQSTTTPARGSYALPPIGEQDINDGLVGAVWYAGDWTGPIALQPEKRLSGESELSPTHDVVAISAEGVKVITIEISHLHPILKSGSPLYRKYLDRRAQQERAQSLEMTEGDHMSATEQLLGEALRTLNILELLNCNSALRKLSAVQKRHLESLAEGPVSFLPGERIWRSGAPVDKAFIIVSGTASFVPRRRNAGSANVPNTSHGKYRTGEETKANCSLGEEMAQDALKAIEELGTNNTSDKHDEGSSASSVDSRKYDHVLQFDSIFSRAGGGGDSVSSHAGDDDFGKLSRDLQRHAENMVKGGASSNSIGGSSVDTSEMIEGESAELDDYGYNDDGEQRGRRTQLVRRRSSKARFANKVLGRLYSRRAFTHGLIFSRGHFLGDVSKMVAGVLSSDVSSELGDDSSPSYGFGEMSESGEHGRRNSQTREISLSVAEMVIHEQGNHNIMHSSTLTAGKEGCVVLVFPKSSFGPFLDEYPGLLLSLLGTQVVV